MGLIPWKKKDPLVGFLNDLFSANVMRVPETRVVPLSAVAVCNDRFSFRGSFPALLKGDPNIALPEAATYSGRVADLVGRRTSKVKLDIGLKVLEGFLGAVGIPSAGVTTQFEGASEVSFAFQDVRRRGIDIGWLGRALQGRIVDDTIPAARIYAFPDECQLLVIDSVITSSDFNISVDKSRSTEIKLDVPAIQKVIGELGIDVGVSTTTGYDITFKGREQLTFAFSCVEFFLDGSGMVTAMKPQEGTANLASAPNQVLSYVPNRVQLSTEPALVEWDD